MLAVRQLISGKDSAYPSTLRSVFGDLAPPDIWFMGNLALLDKMNVGFCGSRHASERGLDVAADCARQLAEAGVTVVSGYAAGVDMASHSSALARGGCTVVVLPEGIEQFKVKKEIEPHWDWDRVLVLSQFATRAIWRADRAMERNKTIVALSRAVIVLEARDNGGTLNAGEWALKLGRPLFVAIYEEMDGNRGGNRDLLVKGGVPLRRSRSTNRAQLRGVFEALERAA